MAQTFEPIDTDLGIIIGRDAFFLDNIQVDYPRHSITLVGEINGHLCSGVSSFDLVINSEWLLHMRMEVSASKVIQEHDHHRLSTYDDVFDVISRGYRLILEGTKSYSE